jgi:hypothetical protein
MMQLNSNGIYPCPACRLGKVQAMPLMEAMACDCCQQIFAADLERQQLKMPSRQPPLVWRWNGRRWIDAYYDELELGWNYILAAIALVALPTAIVGLTVYLFPPLPDTPLFWLPYAWVWLTFLSHLFMLCWLAIEFYQFPVGIFLKTLWQRLIFR